MAEKTTQTLLRKITQKIQGLSSLITAGIVIGGTLLAGGRWMVKEITAATNVRIDSLEQKMENNDKEQQLAIMRVELLTLIKHDPSNTLEIEKYARDYFSQGGDRYMTGIMSEYCLEYGLDCNDILFYKIP